MEKLIILVLKITLTRIVNYNEDDLSFILIGRKYNIRSTMRFLLRDPVLNGNIDIF